MGAWNISELRRKRALTLYAAPHAPCRPYCLCWVALGDQRAHSRAVTRSITEPILQSVNHDTLRESNIGMAPILMA